MMEKILEIIKKYSYTIVIVAVAVVLTVLVIGFNACDNGDDASDSSSGESVSYAELPEFSKAPDSTDKSEGYTAYYYTDVTGDQVSAYIAELEQELDIRFLSQHYPKTATYGDKIIAIHYNVTEKRLSVTIAEKEYNESNNIGE